jgi:hypothetical protein
LSRQTHGLSAAGSEQAHNQRINELKVALLPLEDRLSRALTVGGGGRRQIGTVVDGMDPTLRKEMQRTVRDFRATGTFGKPLSSALGSGGDGIALLLFVYQGQKFVEALSAFDKKRDPSISDWLAPIESFVVMSAAGFAAVQGLSVTILQAHIEQMDSAAGKLNTMSRLGRWFIRNYMEEGEQVDTPNPMLAILGLTPTEDELKPYEGLHTFEIERKGARFMGSLDDDGADLTAAQRHQYGYGKRTRWPLRWWYVRRVIVFWKMPYLIAEWAHRKGRPTLPESVQAWSQSLPPEQWAKPSPALQKANALVKTAMDKKGANFVDACKAAGLH